MDVSELLEKIKSGLIKIIFNKKDKCIGSGTGFLVENYLITNHHVYLGYENAHQVTLRYLNTENSLQEYAEIKLDPKEFSSLLLRGSEENSYDFVILKIPEKLPKKLYKFEIDPNKTIKMCEQVAFPGFPFEIGHVTNHLGYISSVFLQFSGVKTFQIDGSINSGNSGGPLLDIKTGKIFGIITRANKGLTKKFESLKSSLRDNQSKLEPLKGIINIDEICPYEELQKSLLSIEDIAKNLERSASTGIGYGFTIKHIWDDIQSLK